MFYLRGFLMLLCCLFVQIVNAQTDPRVVVVDSTMSNPDAKKDPEFEPRKDTTASLKVETEAKPAVVKDSARLAIERMPRDAARRSAIVPGWGQIKNGHWYKVPIIYGGFVGVGLYLEFNQRYYIKTLRELQFRAKAGNEGQRNDPELINIDERGLQQYKDFYGRNRQVAVLAGLGLYALNIIDAYVWAKFFRFDISDELGFKIRPSVIPGFSNAYMPAPGIKLQIALK